MNTLVGLHLLRKCFPKRFHKLLCQFIVFTLTLFGYTMYHVSRKPLSVVKPVLHFNCSGLPSKAAYVNNSMTACSWKPFDGEDWSRLLGTLDTVYLLSYAAGLYLSGQVVERYNVRYFLLFGMIMCGISAIFFGMGYYWEIHQFYFYLFAQVMGGLSQSTGSPSVICCIGNWFGKKKFSIFGRRGMIMGFWNVHTPLGNMLGAILAGSLLQYGWGMSFIVPGFAIIGYGFLSFCFLPAYQNDVHLENQYDPLEEKETICFSESEKSNPEEELERKLLLPKAGKSDDNAEKHYSIMQCLKIPGVIEYSFCLFFAKAVVYVFMFWLPTYIREEGRYSAEDAADLSTAFDLGGMFGAVLMGVLFDWTGLCAPPISFSLLSGVPALYLFYKYGVMTVTNSIGILFALGVLICGPYTQISTSVATDLGQHKCLKKNKSAFGAVSGIIDGTGSIGAALGPLICGILVPLGWDYVFLFLMISTGIAALLLTRCNYNEILCKVRDEAKKRRERKQTHEELSGHTSL